MNEGVRTLTRPTNPTCKKIKRTIVDSDLKQDTGGNLMSVILKSLKDSKADEIVQIELRGKSTLGDYMIIASGNSVRQLNSISEKLHKALKSSLGFNARIEGKNSGDWVIVDAGDVIVHLFRPEVRAFYQLEKMWQSTFNEPIENSSG